MHYAKEFLVLGVRTIVTWPTGALQDTRLDKMMVDDHSWSGRDSMVSLR